MQERSDDSTRQIFLGRDTVAFDFSHCMAKLVIYTDSMSCSSCQIDRMYEYEEMIDFRSETGEKYLPVFIFSPRKGQGDNIRYTLSITRFRYPVLLDEAGGFPRLNPHIPSDNRCHAFLLDKNGKVILVGNPSRNPALWELYKKTIHDLIRNGGVLLE